MSWRVVNGSLWHCTPFIADMCDLGPLESAKTGYNSCPYLSFFVWRVKRRSLWLDRTKILKY
ncbi:hypothetical protein MTR_3g064660 [Medicago truncatula]|uniref:Uncharacterized protein n=1 Tax=Medicago truncatula TaxID=3880 RepID=G7J8M2_MEDTR|nr:hypothetical protein MTR_3g064660 [Medicago truncatula]